MNSTLSRARFWIGEWREARSVRRTEIGALERIVIGAEKARKNVSISLGDERYQRTSELRFTILYPYVKRLYNFFKQKEVSLDLEI